MLGGSTGGIEDEVPEGEAVALVCFRDEDCLRSGPSGNHGAYESLVTVTLLKRKKILRQNFGTLTGIANAHVLTVKRKFNNLICQNLETITFFVILSLYTHTHTNGHKVLYKKYQISMIIYV